MRLGLEKTIDRDVLGLVEGTKLIVGEESKETGKMVRRRMTEV